MAHDLLHKGSLDAAFARLQAIPWETTGAGPEDERLVELMGEFLGKVRQWHAHLGTGQTHAFQNLAAYLKPTVSLPAVMEEWLEQLLTGQRLPISRGRHYVIHGLRAYLCWECLRETGEIPDVPLADPYEPLMQFFERGGGIYVEHGYLGEIWPGRAGFTVTVLKASRGQARRGKDDARGAAASGNPNEQVLRSPSRADLELQCGELRRSGWRVGEIKEITIGYRRGEDSEEQTAREFAAIATRR